ncbi:MAG: DoxX family protein [Gallionella sp.]
MNFLSRGIKHYYTASHWPEHVAPLLDIFLRVYLANVFFKSGLTKIKTWDSTLYLFSDVYSVPLIPSDVAAYLATAGELALPVLLVLGLFGRFAAAGLFILNAVALYSYYDGLSEAGRNQHLYWGMLIAVLLIISRGLWSLDTWLEKRVP